MYELTSRQKNILKIIVEKYIATATPVSSLEVKKEHFKTLSSPTIRNDMQFLEEVGLLEKTHTSSGRVPSSEGYKYYQEKMLTPQIDKILKQKLIRLFAQRSLSIDTIIDRSVSLINESLKLPSVITTETEDETLRLFEAVKIDNNRVSIILVTSSGSVTNTNIDVESQYQINDISTCVRIFNDRLVGTTIKDIPDKIETIKELIRSQVHEFEFILQKFIKKIVLQRQNKVQLTVKGAKLLPSLPECSDPQKLAQFLESFENSSIWSIIAQKQRKTGKTLISFGKEYGLNNMSIASTSINTNGVKRNLTIVGPTRMDYSNAAGALELIKKLAEEKKD